MFAKITKSTLALLMLGSASLGFTTLASAHTDAHHAAKKHPVAHKQMATMVYAHANLMGVGKSKAHGTAMLTLDTKTHTLTVVLKVWGLAKNSKHADHIHLFKDGKAGAIIHPLSVVSANADGSSVSTTVIKGVDAIDVGGWIINVHESLVNFKVLCNGVVLAGK